MSRLLRQVMTSLPRTDLLNFPGNSGHWYKVYKLEESSEDHSSYDPTDRIAAFQKAQEWGSKIPIGVIYTNPKRPTLEEQIHAIKYMSLVKSASFGFSAPNRSRFERLLEEFI